MAGQHNIGATMASGMKSIVVTARLKYQTGGGWTLLHNKWTLRPSVWLAGHGFYDLLDEMLRDAKLTEQADQVEDCEVKLFAVSRAPLMQRSGNAGPSFTAGASGGQCITCFLAANVTVAEVIDQVGTNAFSFEIRPPAPRRAPPVDPEQPTILDNIRVSGQQRVALPEKKQFSRMHGNHELYNALIDLLAEHNLRFRKDLVADKPTRLVDTLTRAFFFCAPKVCQSPT